MANEEAARDHLRDVASKAPEIGSIIMANAPECTEIIDLALKGVRDVLTKMLTDTIEQRRESGRDTDMYAFKVPFVLIMPKKKDEDAPVV